MKRLIRSGLMVASVSLMLSVPAYANTSANGTTGTGVYATNTGNFAGVGAPNNMGVNRTNGVGGATDGIGGGLRDITTGIGNGVRDVTTGIGNGVRDVANGVGNGVRDMTDGITNDRVRTNNYNGTTTNNNGRYRTNATTTNRNNNWGWLGLLGLVGLAGLRQRHPERES